MKGRRIDVARHKLFLVTLLVVLVAAACTNEPEAEQSARASGEDETNAAPYKHLARANQGEYEGTSVDIMGQWVDAEQENFEAALQPFIDSTGIDVNYEGVTDYETVLNVRVEGGDAPDAAQIAQPGLMRSFQEQGALVNLSEWINTEQLQTDYIESFLDLASVDGDVHGIYYKTDLKSIVWYPVEAFEDNGYEIPQTWDELMALSQQIVDDGNGSPWCISMEHGDATGWVATDWIEDVLLRTAPVEVYDQWVAHEIPFDSPEVLEAAQIVESIWFNPDFVYGGTTGINNTFVGDTQNPMFAKGGPKCWLHKQAAWIPDFWPKDPATDEPLFTPGKDSAFFYLPPIEEEYGRPVLGAGDMFVMFEDRPEVRALMEFLATPEAAQAWIEAGGFVSPNQATPVDWYEAYPSSGLAEIMADSTALRFDASDTMLAEVGQGTFWSGMVDWVRSGGSNTEQVFDKIETGWPDI